MPRLKLIEMDSLNKMIYFRKDDKLIAFDADVAIELISDSLDGKNAPVRHGRWLNEKMLDRGIYINTIGDCSECGYHGMATNYCPYCGAKMEEPTDTPTDT